MRKKIICSILATVVLFSGTMVAHGDEEVGDTTQETMESTEPSSTIPTDPTTETVGSQPETKPKDETESPTKEDVPPVKRVGQVKKLKVKQLKTKSCTLYWSKATNAQGYKIYKYSKKRKKYILHKQTKKTSSKLTGLKSNTTYKYKVKGYRNNHGNTTYGKFSTTKKFKTKKSKKHNRSKLLKKVRSRVGCAYVWGANGPKRFDCSGLVYWSYKGIKTKKKIKRTNCQGMYQALKKYKVSSNIKKAKAGDIILYKNGKTYTHVAIATGKGKMIHAARPGKGVCKAKTTACNYSSVAVIRILK